MALLGRNSRGFGYAGLQDNESTRLLLRKTTSLQDYETTSGAVAGGASQELRNHGFMDFGFAASDNGLWLRFATPDNESTRQRVGRQPELWSHGVTELRNYGTTDLRIYGITDRAKWLKA